MTAPKQPESERDEKDEEGLLHSGFNGPAGEGEIHPTPSQAEGDRGAIEHDIEEKLGGGSGGIYAAGAGLSEQDVQHTPSQAEGDRETIDEDLDEK